MAKNINEHIEWIERRIQKSSSLITTAILDNDHDQLIRSGGILANHQMNLALIMWRKGINPSRYLSELMATIQNLKLRLSSGVSDSALLDALPFHYLNYASYLTNASKSPMRISTQNEHVKSSVFFGNVIIGADDIVNWPKYRDLLPQGKRYDLARQTNDLYAGLLAGGISHEDGVKLGEQLWAEREDHPYFDTGTGGYGNDNENMVDYKLGAILKKIGSTVPTVHAWRW